RHRVESIAQRIDYPLSGTMALASDGGVAIDVIHEQGLEGELSLQVRTNHLPDEPGRPTPQPACFGRCRDDVPVIVERTDLVVVQRCRWWRDRCSGPQRAIDCGQRGVIPGIGIVAFL